MLFESWFGLFRVLVISLLAYPILILVLRISGKRTLAKLNAFDLIVTVSLGSVLATVLLSKSTALAEGVLAFAMLAGLQYLVAFASVRSQRFSRLVKAEPTLLLHRGQFLESAMQTQRITQEEVLAALRGAGVAAIEGTAAVVLETDGSLSVVNAPGEIDTLTGVAHGSLQAGYTNVGSASRCPASTRVVTQRC